MNLNRPLPMLAVLIVWSGAPGVAAINPNLLPLPKGVSIVTCSTVNPNGTVDLNDYVMGLIDVRDKSAGTGAGMASNWQPDMYHGENAPNGAWTARRLGFVFGIASDRRGNIYVAATTTYQVDVFGPAGSGGIYKINGFTGEVYDFIRTAPNSANTWNSATTIESTTGRRLRDLMPNVNAGLGNLAYDYDHDQLLVTNHEDGKIYRVGNLAGVTGTILGTPFDPFANDTPSNGFAPLGERLWAVGYQSGKAYFSRWSKDGGRPSSVNPNGIYWADVDASGALTEGTEQLILTPPNYSGTFSNPISDIEFSGSKGMLVAERSHSSDTIPDAHRSRALLAKKTTGWAWEPTFNPIIGNVFSNLKTNSAGGIDFAYVDEVRGKLIDCEELFWVTGDALYNDGGAIYGMQGSSLAAPTIPTSYFVDFNGILGTADKREQGDVDIWRGPCGEKGCVMFDDVQVECKDKAASTYEVTVNFTYENIDPSENPLENVQVYVNNTLKTIALNPTVVRGSSSSFTFPITGLEGSVHTVTLQAHGPDLPPPMEYEWCCKPQTIEIRLPECRCFNAILVQTPTGPRLQITNFHLISPATQLMIDLQTPANTTISPATFTMTPTGQGSTWMSPPLTFTPALPANATPTAILTLNGRRLANGVYEHCCSETFTLRRPQTVLNVGNINGWIYQDLDLNREFNAGDSPVPNAVVVATLRNGRQIRATTNATGEYSLTGIETNQLVELEATVNLPVASPTQTLVLLHPLQRTTQQPTGSYRDFVIRPIRTVSFVGSGAPTAEVELLPYTYPGKAVEYRIQERAHASVSLHDGAGNLVQILGEQERLPGVHISNFDPTLLDAGEYEIRLHYKGLDLKQSFVADGSAKAMAFVKKLGFNPIHLIF